VSLSFSQLCVHAAKALKNESGPVTLAYAWPQGWSGDDKIILNGFELPLRYCASPLELREALGRQTDSTQVLLVSMQEKELGQDVLGRLFRHRLIHVDRWQLVQDAFDVRQIDPRLFGFDWLPELLLASTPVQRTSTAAALTYDEAMQSCLVPVLGVSREQLDTQSLLIACEHSGQRWAALESEPREAFRTYLTAQLGSLAAALLAAMEAGNGHAVFGIGLVCEILYAQDALQIPTLRDARVRLEQRLKGYRLNDSDGRQWAQLATRCFEQRGAKQQQSDFRVGIDLLDQIGASEFVGRSSILPEALESRLSELGNMVVKFLRAPEALAEVETAARWVLAHRRVPVDHPGPEIARMVARLCRRHAQSGAFAPAADAIKDYLDHGAWEDWARRTLRGARPEALARAVTKLLDQVADRRAIADETFARSVADTAMIGDVPAGLSLIESALPEILAPLAQQNALLMIVLDGMSQDVYLAITESMIERGWTSWARDGLPLALLATVPSVTECSRASLLSGRLNRGAASQEKQAFAQHEALKRISKAGKPPVLLHKAGLEQSHQLSTEAADAIADSAQRVIGIVINAIDDALAKSEQVRIDWTMESIPLLAEVLEHARRASRTVLLTSDHGHVLERQSKLRPDGEGERWRSPGRLLEQGEILVSGPRVNTLVGGSLVVPWSETLRYGPKKNGYHGGISRQEMLVPFGIWTGPGQQPESDAAAYESSYRHAPSWWSDSDDVATPPSPAAKPRRSDPVSQPGDLFSMAPTDNWLERLMTSPLLARQRERIGRIALPPDRLHTLLAKLQRHGGRCSIEQLASAIDQPALRMRGVISVLERMLNVDGFAIVTMEQGSGTVLLDVSLLKAQFLT
jgi:hypothetical protein